MILSNEEFMDEVCLHTNRDTLSRSQLINLLKKAPIPESIECPEAKNRSSSNGCQGCSACYDDDHVMIIDDLGPVCFKCLYWLAYIKLS